jgi:hypothetical protein
MSEKFGSVLIYKMTGWVGTGRRVVHEVAVVESEEQNKGKVEKKVHANAKVGDGVDA